MYHQLTIKETERQTDTNISSGLSEEVAALRLKDNGENALKEGKKKSPLMMFLEQLNEPLIYVLLIAVVISIALKEVSDAMIIAAVVLMNGIVGVIQEGKAIKALEALKKLTTPTAIVKRNNCYQEISAKHLVKGDIVSLEAGAQIPADLRLISATNLKIEESALTGESLATTKNCQVISKEDTPLGDRKNMAFMTSTVSYGRGEGVVVATGMDTEIGKIAALINKSENSLTPLQKRLADLGKLLSIMAVGLCAVLFLIALFQQRNILEMLITAISLAVAAVPEGLPAVVTIVLAMSVSKMVKVNTIIRKLPSVETLGAVSIVCSDKTGTLTENKMTVTKLYTNGKTYDAKNFKDYKNRVLIEGMVLCNDAFYSKKSYLGDPTEIALVEMGEKLNANKDNLIKQQPRIGEIPFDSKRKMMTTLHRQTDGLISYTKGSCDEILKRSKYIYMNNQKMSLTVTHKKEIEKAMSEMASSALRVLALAVRHNDQTPVEKDLIFVGLVGMIDPPRKEAIEAIELFKGAGVKTVMITGDHKDTALAIAKTLKIADSEEQCLTGKELDILSKQELKQKLETVRVFARVSPEHKVKIVNLFKEDGHIVAMTGDGVNDAPSLKSADIGIAMGKNGTDVAKNASDLVLADDNFATIEKAIKEGREIYENIKKSVLFLLSSNFGEIITMFTAILLGLPTPLKASHILWVNLLTDSLPALALGVDQNDGSSLMKKSPRDPKESIFAGGGLKCTIFYGCLIAFLSLTAFLTIPYATLKANDLSINLTNFIQILEDSVILERAQTYAFTVLGVSQLFHAIGMRDRELSLFKMKLLSNRLMIVALVAGLALQGLVTEVPYCQEMFGTASLGVTEWGMLLFLSIMPLVAHELLVVFNFKEEKRRLLKTQRVTA